VHELTEFSDKCVLLLDSVQHRCCGYEILLEPATPTAGMCRQSFMEQESSLDLQFDDNGIRNTIRTCSKD